VGPGKTGSTWLYENLKNHPDIKLPKNIKETNYYLNYNCPKIFFNKFFNYGIEKKINIDISNTYIYNKDIAKVIKENHPNAKIIIGYRSSIQRLESMYLFKQRNGEIPIDFSLKDALINDKYKLIEHSMYFNFSEPYINEFSKENIFIMNFDLIKKEPEKLIENFNNFLNVSNDYSKENLYKVFNPASKFRIPFLSKYSKVISNFLRKINLYIILDFVKSNKFIQLLLFKKINKIKKSTIKPDDIDLINHVLEDDNSKFKSFFLLNQVTE
jgi:hypothetical protein